MGFEDWYDAGAEPDGDDPGGTRCKHCGAEELTWENHEGRWVLVTLGGRRHECPANLDARPKPTDPLTDFKEFLT